MKVSLVSTTAPIHPDFEGDTSTEAILIYIARVSSSRSDKVKNIEDLIKYLIRNHHWSPFEMVGMCIEIVTSRAISLQIIRHRSFSYQQFSQRYAKSTEFEPIELRYQAMGNRQSSFDVVQDELLNRAVQENVEKTNDLYNVLLDKGVSKETARFILPETTQTRLYMNGTMRSWIHFLQIRDEEHAQKEHRLVAQEIKKIFFRQMPITSMALGWIQ